MKTLAAVVLALAAASPVAAQSSRSSGIAIRPFVMVAGEQFAAKETFKAIFGQSAQPFLGGGVELVTGRGVFLDVTVSRFSKKGERAFVSDDGEAFSLGIPVTVTLVPIEVSAGYRFRIGQAGRVSPYVGGGFGSYGYTESDETEADDLTLRHTGFLAVGGIEYRAGAWVAVSADVQYTNVSGILGDGGVSEQVGESNLGGIAARFRIILGK